MTSEDPELFTGVEEVVSSRCAHRPAGGAERSRSQSKLSSPQIWCWGGDRSSGEGGGMRECWIQPDSTPAWGSSMAGVQDPGQTPLGGRSGRASGQVRAAGESRAPEPRQAVDEGGPGQHPGGAGRLWTALLMGSLWGLLDCRDLRCRRWPGQLPASGMKAPPRASPPVTSHHHQEADRSGESRSS